MSREPSDQLPDVDQGIRNRCFRAKAGSAEMYRFRYQGDKGMTPHTMVKFPILLTVS